jgi:excisionase family DNA binding protein
MQTVKKEAFYYSVLEVSLILRVTPQTVRRYLKEGKLEGEKRGGFLLIPENALRKYLKLPVN